VEIDVGKVELRFFLDVAGEEKGPAAGCDAEHDRRIVFRRAPEPRLGHVCGDAEIGEVELVAVADELNWRALRLEDRGGAVAAEAAGRDADPSDVELREHGRESFTVIGMCVREHDRVDAPDATIGEQRQDALAVAASMRIVCVRSGSRSRRPARRRRT
jgi:hypothetical protein